MHAKTSQRIESEGGAHNLTNKEVCGGKTGRRSHRTEKGGRDRPSQIAEGRNSSEHTPEESVLD